MEHLQIITVKRADWLPKHKELHKTVERNTKFKKKKMRKIVKIKKKYNSPCLITVYCTQIFNGTNMNWTTLRCLTRVAHTVKFTTCAERNV